MMAKIIEMLFKVNPDVKFKYRNMEKLTIIGDDGTLRTVFCYPDRAEVCFFFQKHTHTHTLFFELFVVSITYW
jgi:hypothetical protein